MEQFLNLEVTLPAWVLGFGLLMVATMVVALANRARRALAVGRLQGLQEARNEVVNELVGASATMRRSGSGSRG
jgi:hypothetical protein